MTRWFSFGLLVALTLACSTTHRRARPDLAPEDRGAAELSTLLRDFKVAVTEHRFGVAEEMLSELEEGIKKADMRTIAHPDYADVSHAVDGARPALARAKREWAITQLIVATTKEVGEADAAAQTLRDALNEDPLEDLEDSLEDLSELAEQGKEFKGEERYQTFIAPVEEHRLALATLAAQSRWRLAAGDAVKDALADYSDAPPPDATSLDDQIDRCDRQLRQLDACGERATELRQRPGFAAELEIETPLGRLALDALEKGCQTRRSAIDQRVTTLRWRREVGKLIAPASAAVQAVADQQTVDAKLEKSDEAIERLREGEVRLAELASAPGADGAAVFSATFGNGNLAKLTEMWKAQLAKLVAAQPTWRWQIALTQLAERAKEAKERLAAAQKAEAGDRIEALNQALGGFSECSERADHLAARGDPAWKDAQPSKSESKAVSAIAADCRADADKTRALLAPPKPAPPPKKTGKKPKTSRKRKR